MPDSTAEALSRLGLLPRVGGPAAPAFAPAPPLTSPETGYHRWLEQNLSLIERFGDLFTGLDQRLDYLNRTMLRLEALLSLPQAPAAPAPIYIPGAPPQIILEQAAPAPTVVEMGSPLSAFTLEQLYTAIRLNDIEADVQFIYEEVLDPSESGWTTAYEMGTRIDIQRYFWVWGDPSVEVSWGIDNQERQVGPFRVPPNATRMEFTGYWEKRRFYIYRKNYSDASHAELHLVMAGVRPKAEDWTRYWKPQLLQQMQRLKGEA